MILQIIGLSFLVGAVRGTSLRITGSERLCRADGQIGVGFCVASGRLGDECVGGNVLVRQSTDCLTADDWCCFGSSGAGGSPRVPRVANSESKRLIASGTSSEETGSSDTVDSAPCGLGRNDRKLGVGGSAGTGVRQFARVFQGTPTVEGDFCWVAAIFGKGNASLNEPSSFLCSGSIINSTHIITAGHCVDNFLTNPAQIFIATGLNNAGPPIPAGSLTSCSQEFQVLEVLLPARYDPDALTEDHALLRIRGAIQADECSCRVCLPDRGAVPEVTGGPASCWVAGFGATREGGAGSMQLTKSPIQLLLGGMLTAGSHRFPLPDSAFCAGDAQQGGLCSHDGGAPLTCLIDGRHTLVGVGSWSIDCSKYPSVFSSVAACADFLIDINAPCDAKHAMLKGAMALTDLQLNGGPSCGITGNNEIDPFQLARQSPATQAFNAARIKRTVQAIVNSLSSTSLAAATSHFQMLAEENILGIDALVVSEEVEEKIATDAVTTTTAIPFPLRPVVGGSQVPLNQICWQVLLSSGCGGSIISDQFILTAAHCVTLQGTTIPRRASSLKVILGATSSPVQFPLTSCQQIRKISRVIVHEDYFLGNATDIYVANDIALLQLDSPIDFTQPCVCRVCLQINEPAAGEVCTASGFGCQAPTAPSSACADRTVRGLMKLNVTMPGDDVCGLFFQNFPSDRVTCSASDKGHAPCFGDSGGPIVCYNNDKSTYYQAGITSFAVFPDGVTQCGNGNVNLQYYTKVDAFIGWIRETVPDVMVAEPGSFNFHASFNIDLGKGASSIVTNNQLLPAING